MTWKRQGECNHCGFCCLFLSNIEVELNSTRAELVDTEGNVDEKHLHVRGFERGEGDAYHGKALFYSPCEEYNIHEMRCSIQASKPKTCVEFPAIPEQVLGTPCSYYFEECVDGHAARMGGDQSPYPGRTFEKNGLQFKDLTPYPTVRYPLILPRHVEVKS